MKYKNQLLLILLLLGSFSIYGRSKVFIIHGYGSFQNSMEKISKTLNKNGFTSELISYSSLSEDISLVAKSLYYKICSEHLDSVSFVTHSMGALIVREMYTMVDTSSTFPYIHRFVMMAPPNRGTPVADFISTYPFIKPLFGPNIEYMKTDSASVANNLPIPSCEVGLILGIRGKEKGYNPLIVDDNDGVISSDLAILGNEKDIAFIKSIHYVSVMERKSMVLILNFLRFGSFKPD